MLSSDRIRRGLPTLTAVIPLIIIFITVLSIPLAAAQELRLSTAETTSWILAVWGLPGLLGLVLIVRYRQPLLLTGNIFSVIFVASLGGQISYPELVGAFIVAGFILVLLSVLGLTGRFTALIPPPIVYGLLAGAIMPFVSGIFTAVGDAPALVIGSFLAYLWGRRTLEPRIPAILPAFIAGLVIAAVTGQFGSVSTGLSLPVPVITTPVFTLEAIVTATPVFVVLMTAQANLPSVVFLESQGYRPPEKVINIVSGIGTVIGSLLGPAGFSLSLPATALVAGPGAGERHVRHRSAYLASGALMLIALLAALAAELPAIISLPFLLALAGLSLIDVFIGALQQITQGPLLLGPLFAFVVTLSQISLLGLGPFFWALIIGTGISLLLEQDGLRQLSTQAIK